MGKIEDIEIHSYTEYASAVYTDDDGEEYEITLTRTYDETIGYEMKEVVHIEKDGMTIDDDELRQSIRACLP